MFGTSLSSSSAKGVLLFGVLVLLATGLFFIPELINFQDSLWGPTTQPTTEEPPPAVPVPEAVPEIPPPPQSQSSLDRVLSKIDSGEFDEAPVVGGSAKDSARTAERVAMAKKLRTKPLTWEVLQSAEVKAPVRTAFRECQTLMKILDPTKTRSRTAVLNFMNGLRFFARPDATPVSPHDVLGYLGRLDVAVTQAFIADRVGKTEYDLWKAISLGPLIDLEGAEQLKRGHTPGFEADFTLVNVWVRERIETDRVTKERRFVYDVTATAIVTGRDVKKIEVFVGRVLKEQSRPNTPPRDNIIRSRFRLVLRSIPPGKVTIRLLDDLGGVLEKVYAFGVGARKLGRDSKGEFNIPQITDPVTLYEVPPDRVDRLFRVGRARRYGSGGGSRGFNDLENSFTVGGGSLSGF